MPTLRQAEVTAADAVAFHGYVGSIPEGILYLETHVRAAMSNHGIATKPIYDTEGGWGMNSALPSMSDRPGYLAREFLLQWSSGVSGVYWYAWNNPTWGTLWTSSGIQPAGIAYGQVHGWIDGATLNSPCAMASDSTWTCSFKRSSVRPRRTAVGTLEAASPGRVGRHRAEDYLRLLRQSNHGLGHRRFRRAGYRYWSKAFPTWDCSTHTGKRRKPRWTTEAEILLQDIPVGHSTRKRAVHAPTTFRVVYRLRGDPVVGHRGSDVGFQMRIPSGIDPT